jgi:hypothetical protein
MRKPRKQKENLRRAAKGRARALAEGPQWPFGRAARRHEVPVSISARGSASSVTGLSQSIPAASSNRRLHAAVRSQAHGAYGYESYRGHTATSAIPIRITPREMTTDVPRQNSGGARRRIGLPTDHRNRAPGSAFLRRRKQWQTTKETGGVMRNPAGRLVPKIDQSTGMSKPSPWAVRLFWFSLAFAAVALVLWLASWLAGPDTSPPMPSGTTTIEGNRTSGPPISR